MLGPDGLSCLSSSAIAESAALPHSPLISLFIYSLGFLPSGHGEIEAVLKRYKRTGI